MMLQRREEEMNKGGGASMDETRKGEEDGKWRGKI